MDVIVAVDPSEDLLTEIRITGQVTGIAGLYGIRDLPKAVIYGMENQNPAFLGVKGTDGGIDLCLYYRIVEGHLHSHYLAVSKSRGVIKLKKSYNGNRRTDYGKRYNLRYRT